MDQKKKYAALQVRGQKKSVQVPVATSDKPFISEEIMEKWQAMVDILVEFADVASCMVLHLDADALRVLVAAEGAGSFFQKGESFSPGSGVYCETVLGLNQSLNISDASGDPVWKDNPAIEQGLIAYFGLPLLWPDGDFFGSLCMHDSRSHVFGDKILKLMAVFKDNIEKDLSVAYMNFHALKSVNKRMLSDIKRLETVERDLLRALEEKELLLDEVYFRIKNNLHLISELLEIQEEGSDPELVQQLRSIRNCILSIQVVHDLLREGDGQTGLNLSFYLNSLVSFLGTVYSAGDIRVEIAATIDKGIFLAMKQATYVGLIIYQVLADFAEKSVSARVFSLSAEKTDDDYYRILIRTSCSEEAGCRGSEKGRRIIQALTSQLNGNSGYSTEGDLVFYLEFSV